MLVQITEDRINVYVAAQKKAKAKRKYNILYNGTLREASWGCASSENNQREAFLRTTNRNADVSEQTH